MDALISVIIPVYNREKYLGECIASLQAQSYPMFEIILIDDGSTDKTLEICQKLAAEDSRIVLLNGSHCGVSAARNKGLDIAKGEYVLFVDSDDVIHPLLLEELVESMAKNDAPMGGSAVVSVPHSKWHRVNEIIAKETDFCGTEHLSNEETLHAVFHSITPLNMIGGVMMLRNWVDHTRFREDLFIGEDFWFIYENLIKGASAVFLNKKRYYARVHDENTSWDYSYEGFWTRFYRRELVWKNEEAMGRTEYAKLQKQQGFGCYLLCLTQNTPGSDEIKKMQRTMRNYQSVLLPAQGWKGKLRFFVSVYTPSLYLIADRIEKKLKKSK